jgi:hypothetical protein
MIPMSKIQNSFFALAGGLDLVTPAIEMPAGRASAAQNYEPEIAGGYRRIDGYERFDGHLSPARNCNYIVLPATLVRPLIPGSVFAIGVTVKGGTSGATGCLAAVSNGRVVLSKVAGTFLANESLTIGSGASLATVAVVTGDPGVAATPAEDADFRAAAADTLRADILKVPGMGPIRGIWVLNDQVFVFRDSDDGSKGRIFKATPAGWSPITFGYELPFKNGTTEIKPGDTVTNGGTATGVVTKVVLRSGTWGTDAQGSLFFLSLTNAFASGNPIKIDINQVATAAAASSQISRGPWGHIEAINYNFSGAANPPKMYGVDGINRAWEFDGFAYWPITTGMAIDAPAHLAIHRNILFLSFGGSIQFSAPGNPFSWSVVVGAGEIATGDDIKAMIPAAGNQEGAALAIFTQHRTHMLYGSSANNFVLQTSSFDDGYAEYTCQPIGNDVYGMGQRGIQVLSTTQRYGNFQFDTISRLIQPLMARKQGMESASTVLHAKNQYRLFFRDGTGLVVGLAGDNISGILPLNYGRPVRCICTATFADGSGERTFFGSDDGYVYEDNIGTSFDGQPIEAYVRLPFHHANTPRVRKRWRRAVLEVSSSAYCQVNVSYDIGYGQPDVAPPDGLSDQQLNGGGVYWDADQMIWDQFNWDAQPVLSPVVCLDGTEKNLSLVFYSSRAQDVPHILQGVTLLYTTRRIERD